MKIIRIEKCGECPHYSYYPNAKGYYCSKMGFVLPETGIPEWCPLPDANKTGYDWARQYYKADEEVGDEKN